jgi:hypothetical protein
LRPTSIDAQFELVPPGYRRFFLYSRAHNEKEIVVVKKRLLTMLGAATESLQSAHTTENPTVNLANLAASVAVK